ncbi:MAG: hypothetical protein LBI85_05105, partial [Spirochaetaceae bacterium]|nr:hypothetical protein [Spirochaetaceae bacterium]
MIELSAQIAQPQEPSRADSPLESLAGRGPGRTKDAKEKDKTENFASLVKNLLENVKNAAPGLAEGQIQPENTGEALKPGKNQGRKSATLTIIPQDKDGLALSKAKTGRSGIFRDETDGNERLFLSKPEETDRNTGLIGSIRHEQETQDLPFPVEEGDFPQNDGIHSLAGLMQRNDAGEAAGSGRDAALKDRNVLFAGLPGKTGRTEASGQDPRRGLADLNKAGKGDQEEVRDRRRERIARSPGAGNRFEIRDFRGDAEIKSPLGKSGDFGFSGP